MADVEAGRLTLSPGADPDGWRVANLPHLASLPAVILFCFDAAAHPASPCSCHRWPCCVRLRVLEQTDPAVLAAASRVRQELAYRGSRRDQSVQRDGHLKPGPRLLTTMLVLWVIDWARGTSTNGDDTAVRSNLHFARWVFLDSRRR
jgi:hypothetical protein